MLFTIAIVLAAASLFTEVKLVHSFPKLNELYTHPKYGTWVNTGMSFLLSWFTGALFGASGLTIAVAGALSTAASQAYFWIEGGVKRSGVTMDGLRASYKTHSNNAREVWEDFSAIISDVAKVFRAIHTAIAFIPRQLRRGAVAYKNYRNNHPQLNLKKASPF